MNICFNIFNTKPCHPSPEFGCKIGLISTVAFVSLAVAAGGLVLTAHFHHLPEQYFLTWQMGASTGGLEAFVLGFILYNFLCYYIIKRTKVNFSIEGHHSGGTGPTVVEAVKDNCEILQRKSPYRESIIVQPNDKGTHGTCTAMTLDFASRLLS